LPWFKGKNGKPEGEKELGVGREKFLKSNPYWAHWRPILLIHAPLDFHAFESKPHQFHVCPSSSSRGFQPLSLKWF
jgi:hypothetical protein